MIGKVYHAYHTEQSVTNGERKEGVTVCINASTHPASWMDCFGSGIDADYEVCVARRLGGELLGQCLTKHWLVSGLSVSLNFLQCIKNT